MREETNEIKFDDSTTPENENKRETSEIAKSPQLEKFGHQAAAIQETIAHDRPIEAGQVLALEEQLGNLTVDLWGVPATLRGLQTDPEIQNDIKTYQKLVDSNYDFRQLTSISLRLAKKLLADSEINENLRSLLLENLTELRPEVAEVLGKFKGFALVLGDIDITPETAALLGKFQGKNLALGTSGLSAGIAEGLAKFNGRLYFPKLEGLTPETAKALSKHEELTEFYRLKTLDDIVAKNISRKKDTEKGISGGKVSFLKVTSISPQAAEYLSQNENVRLALETLSDEIAEKFSTMEGALEISSIDEISDKAAEFLSHHKGPLNLMGLREINDTVMNLLARHEGQVKLNVPNTKKLGVIKADLGLH